MAKFEESSSDFHTPRSLTTRQLGSVFAGALLFAAACLTSMGAGVSHAWTNVAKNYSLVEIAASSGLPIATDAQGNAYHGIQFKNTFTFGSVTATVGSSWRYLILKSDSSGTPIWGTVVLDGTGDLEGITVDSSGNVYAVGLFSGTASSSGTSITSAGGNDIFIEKFNSSGVLQWIRTFGGTGADWGNGVDVDGNGNVYMSGGMQQTVAFGSTSLTSAGGNDLFLTKLNSSGTVQWATRVGGTGDDNGGYLQGLAVDAAGNAWVSGQIVGTVTVASTSLTSAGGRDVFVGKVNPSGVWQWGAIGGSTASENDFGIAVDSAGNAYTVGVYRGAATFGSTSLTFAGGVEDAFIAKLDASGTWQWARAVKGTGSDYAEAVAVDSTGNPVVAGYFNSPTLNVGSTALTFAGGTATDGWFTRLDASGNFQWAQQLSGTGDDGFYGVAYDSYDNIRLSGWGGKSTTLSFNGDTPMSILSSCVTDCWAYADWKVSPTGGVPSNVTTSSSTSTTSTVAPSTTVASSASGSASTTTTTSSSSSTTSTASTTVATTKLTKAAATNSPSTTAVVTSTADSVEEETTTTVAEQVTVNSDPQPGKEVNAAEKSSSTPMLIGIATLILLIAAGGFTVNRRRSKPIA